MQEWTVRTSCEPPVPLEPEDLVREPLSFFQVRFEVLKTPVKTKLSSQRIRFEGNFNGILILKLPECKGYLFTKPGDSPTAMNQQIVRVETKNVLSQAVEYVCTVKNVSGGIVIISRADASMFELVPFLQKMVRLESFFPVFDCVALK
jgi:hypothetical protein